MGAVIDPGPLKIVTVEDIENAARQRQADADLSALIAPPRVPDAMVSNGSSDGSSSDGASSSSGDADYGEPDG
jgi:hypothetical protein